MKTPRFWPLVCAIAFSQTPVLTLNEAIAEAVANNPDLKAERLNVDIVQTRQITAALRPNPVLTISGQSLDLLGTRFNPASPAGPNQFNAHTDFVLERGGKRQERIQLAAAEKTLTQLEQREILRRLTFDVQTAYVDAQSAIAAVTLAESNLKSLRGIVEINESRVRSGDLAQVELDRSRVAALQYEVSVETARLDSRQAVARLRRLIGRAVSAPEFTVATDLRRDSDAAAAPLLLDRARTQRPDLQMAKQGQARSSADLKLQVANGKVDYVLGSEYTYQRAYGYGGNSLGFSFSMPLPVFNKNQGEIARAERQIKQAEARIAAIEAGISSEVDIAYRQFDTSRRLLDQIEKTMLTQSKSVRDITEYSYRRGEASLIEFLDAQRAFNDSVQSYNQARAAYARSLYLIDAVTGQSAPATGGN